MKVRDPHQETWRVSRRWVPWRRRTPLPAVPSDLGPGGLGVGDDRLSILLRAVPLAVAMVELLLIVLVLPLAVLARVLLGRHWVVEVRADYQPVWEIDAGSWGQSREAIHELGAVLGRGAYPWHDGAPGVGRGRVLEEWVLAHSTADHATFRQRRRR